MHYAYADWFWLSGLAGAIIALVVAGTIRKRRLLRRLAQGPTREPLLLVSRRRQFLKAAMLIAAAVLLGIVLLGPQWGRTTAEPQPAQGRDVLVVLDVSRSMLAEDVAPNRLERARADVRDLASLLEARGGCRVGLIAFADRAALLCPLTFDFRTFQEELSRVSLERLRIKSDVGGEHGTLIGLALRRAAQAIDPQTAAYTDVLLISDGDDMESDTLHAADQLARLGVAVHTIGLGDPAKGWPIPVPDGRGGRANLTFRGETVLTRLEEDVLRGVAERTGGQYVPARTGFVELDRVYDRLLGAKPTRELAAGGSSQSTIHRYQWFLAPALALLLLEIFLSDRRRGTSGAPARTRYFTWVHSRRRTTVGQTT